MDAMSGKVQNASTHPLQCRSREHAHTAVSQFKGQFKGVAFQWGGARLARRRLEAVNLALWVGADGVVNGVDSRFGLTQHLKMGGRG